MKLGSIGAFDQKISSIVPVMIKKNATESTKVKVNGYVSSL